MDKLSGKLTVYFEDPFWVGVFERISDGKLYVSKVTFGPEPSEQEIMDFILKSYTSLRFSPAVDMEPKQHANNPKRRQRQIRRQLQTAGIGTKSQQALQRQREERKEEHRRLGREQEEEEKQRRYQLRQQKRKEKHRGH